jgi:hypothetical protein
LIHSTSLNEVYDSLQLYPRPNIEIREATAPNRNGFSHAHRQRPVQMTEQLFLTLNLPPPKDLKFLKDQAIMWTNLNQETHELICRIVAVVEIDGVEVWPTSIGAAGSGKLCFRRSAKFLCKTMKTLSDPISNGYM